MTSRGALLIFLQLSCVVSAHAASDPFACDRETGNDYLEAELSKAVLEPSRLIDAGGEGCNPAASSEPCRNDSKIVPEACVRTAMKRRPNPIGGVFYGTCETPLSTVATKDVPAPCVSDALVQYTRRAYLDAIKCIGEDPRAFFGLIAVESSFMLNVGNSAGAWGLGQLTPPAYNSVDDQDWFKEFRGKKECAGLEDLLGKREGANVGVCELISLPENPARNVLYSATVYRQMRRAASRIVPRGVGDRAKIVRELTQHMYNGGNTAVGAVFMSYLAEYPEGAASYEAFASFREYLRQYYGAGMRFFEKRPKSLANKRNQVADYPAKIRREVSIINRRAKQECGK